MRRLFLPAIALAAVCIGDSPDCAAAGQRNLLWAVVETCLVNHKITGAAFPCLAVDTSNGRETGYIVLRPLDDGRRVIVSPTVPTVGIEARRLRGADAPPYLTDAWAARHYVTDNLPKKPARDDLALAVNSRPGRSQDQLHIHVSCIRADVKARLNDSARDTLSWRRIKVLPGAPTYWMRFEPSQNLDRVNIFDTVADGLRVSPDHMDEVTIVIVGHEPTGFVVLARKKIPNSADEPHGEALLDPTCRAFDPPK